MSEARAIRRREALAAFGALGAAAALGGRAGAAEETLRVAGVPFDQTAEPYYARAMGFYRKAGLAVELDSFSTSGAAIAAAVSGGAMDIGVSNIPSLAAAHARGVPFVILAPAGIYTSASPVDALMVAKSSPIRTARDLEGKTVAVNGLKSIAQFGPQAWIDQNGGRSEKVNFVEIPASQTIPALESGRVDAGLVIEPFLSAGKNVARVLANCFDAIAPRFIVSGFFTTPAWARAHADTVRRFQQAMEQTAVWANANHAETAKILAQASKIPEARINATNRVAYAERADPALIQPVIDIVAKYGGGKKFPAEELLYHPG